MALRRRDDAMERMHAPLQRLSEDGGSPGVRWAGYRIGTGGSQLPEIMFRMPSGLMIGLLLLGCAGIFSYWAAKEYADEKKTLWRPLAGAAISTILGGLTFTVSL